MNASVAFVALITSFASFCDVYGCFAGRTRTLRDADSATDLVVGVNLIAIPEAAKGVDTVSVFAAVCF